MFDNIYSGKKVVVTGHTGFKGTWLSAWLIKLGANVVGISKDIPTKPSMFEELKLENSLKHYILDVTDVKALREIFIHESPDYVFHLAAQPIVSVSYQEPYETIQSNVLGTASVLEALRVINSQCFAIIITSDKAYNNVEQLWGYKETDKLGGKDIYSGSKGAAELIISSYFHSFFSAETSNVKLAIGRAGNVIGGGDWAKDRIVVDAINAWSKSDSVDIRSPNSTRPWQHVLEPLSGYLTLGMALARNSLLNGEAFNFGPRSDQNFTVQKLITDLGKYWKFTDKSEPFLIGENKSFREANLLKLNCEKAQLIIGWTPVLNYSETIRFTGSWYYNYFDNNKEINMFDYTFGQIDAYSNYAVERKLSWAE